MSALVLLVVSSPIAGCSGRTTVADEWAEGACLKHADCASGETCVLGTCTRGAGREPVDVGDINAAQWFLNADGSCSYDNECGPWMCFRSECVEPAVANRPMLAREVYRYWDTSCYTASDCGPWICADGWCTQPGFVAPYATVQAVAPAGGASCLGDNECPEGGDCVFPGYCQAGVADEPMTFIELGAISWYGTTDGSCSTDAECGPHACDGGWCIAQELADRARPARRNFFYYDASCSTDEQCGAWVCRDGFCNDPAYP